MGETSVTATVARVLGRCVSIALEKVTRLAHAVYARLRGFSGAIADAAYAVAMEDWF